MPRLERTRNKDIPVVSYEILNDVPRAVNDVDIAPVDPCVVGLESSGEQVVAGPAHGLPARTLRLEAVAIRDILAEMESKVLLDDRCAPEGNGVRALLDPLELHRQHSHCIIGRVADEEGDVNQVVRVAQLGKQLEVLGQVRRCILQRGQDEYPLLVLECLLGRLDGVEVDTLDGGGVDLYRRMMIEDDGSLEVLMP